MPADTIKTRVLNGGGGGVWACVRDTARLEGVGAFFRGYVPAICRQCPVILVQMPLIEAIRSLCGLRNI